MNSDKKHQARLRSFKRSAIMLGILGALLCAELFLRVAWEGRLAHTHIDWQPPGSMVYDDVLSWSYRPGYEDRWKYFEFAHDVHINALGMRDVELTTATVTPDPPRILFIGDSFTFGAGVELEQTFVKHTEARLAEAGQVFQCLNASRINSGTNVYLEFARRYIPPLMPEHVVIVLFLDNDIYDTYNFKTPQQAGIYEKDGEPWLLDQPLTLKGVTQEGALYRTSVLYRTAVQRLSRFSVNNVESLYVAMGLIDIYRQPAPAWVEEAWQQVRANLESIRNLCEAHGIGVSLVLMPADFNVDPVMWERLLRESDLSPETYDWRRPFVRAETLAADLSLPVLDLSPAFARADHRLYYKHDRHLTARGHAVAARAISEFLISRFEESSSGIQ